MSSPPRLRSLLAGVLLAGVATLGAACTRTVDVAPGSLSAGGVTLAGQTYRVGSKDFPEQRVLCEATIVALRSLGATAEDRCGIPDGAATRAALVPADRIDLYWEYTGTAAGTFLADERPRRGWPSAPAALYAAVRDADAARGVVWLTRAPFDDTYAIAASRPVAERLGVRTVSDWARLVESGSPDATTCIEPEFASRPDGLSALLRAYRVTRPYDGPPGLVTVDQDVVYDSVARAAPCAFGEVFSTDGRVRADDLVLLTDDRDHFPTYNAAPTVRREVLERAPALGTVLDRLAPRLTDPVIRDLNAQVLPGGRDPEEVVTAWLLAEGLVARG